MGSTRGMSRVGLDRVADAGVTLVLPCLNEEKAIELCVKRALTVFEDARLKGRVLVVDNGSSDRSVEIALEAGARVVHQSEPGYGAALRSGFNEADTEFVVMADADGTYELEAIPRLILPLVENTADLVLGSRLDDATTATMPWLHRYVGTPLLSMLVRRASGRRTSVRDGQSGFRAFRREQLLALELTSTGMEFASEMLIRYAWARFRITEVNTTYSPRIGESKLSTFSDGLRHLRQILLLSPDIFANDPGIAMTGTAFVLWALACMSQQGLGRTGSLSWIATLVAGVLGVIGPITYCTGLGIRYRAESFGYLHPTRRVPLSTLIWRFFFAGVYLVSMTIILSVALVVNFHHRPNVISEPVAQVLGSVTRSSGIVGIVLMCAPILSPFLTQNPMFTLPKVEEETGSRADA